MTALNSGMADTKPDFKTKLEKIERRNSSRLTKELPSSAGWLAVALLVACIGGGLCIGQLEQTIRSPQNKLDDTKADKTSIGGNTYHITYKNGDKIESEDVTINTETETETFIKKDEDGNISSIAVADFYRDIVAMYIPKEEECYMASGVHSWMPNASASIQDYEKEDGTEIVDGEDDKDGNTVNFVVATDTAVTDHSILPADIRPLCAGKPLYWVNQTPEKPQDRQSTDVSSGTRNRRAICYDYKYYCYSYYSGGWKRNCYWKVYYYSC